MGFLPSVASQFGSSYSILWRPRPAAKSADAATCEVEVEVGVEIKLVESRNSIDQQWVTLTVAASAG